jgi:hypothetical protein
LLLLLLLLLLLQLFWSGHPQQRLQLLHEPCPIRLLGVPAQEVC